MNGETLEPSTTTQRAHLEPRNVPLLRAGVPHISLSSQIALRSISPLPSSSLPFSFFSPSDEKIPSSWSFLYSPGARATIRRIAPAVGTSVLWARYAQGGPFDPQLESYTASSINKHFSKHMSKGVSFRPRANGLPCTASLIPINEFSIPLTITCCCLSLRLVDGCRSVGARRSGLGWVGWLGWGEGRREKLSLAPATQKVF